MRNLSRRADGAWIGELEESRLCWVGGQDASPHPAPAPRHLPQAFVHALLLECAVAQYPVGRRPLLTKDWAHGATPSVLLWTPSRLALVERLGSRPGSEPDELRMRKRSRRTSVGASQSEGSERWLRTSAVGVVAVPTARR